MRLKYSKQAKNMIECGCCGHYHRKDYYGDCRNDRERFILDFNDEEFVSCDEINTKRQ